MRAYLPDSNPTDDYSDIRVNGTWYQEWQSGYHDILKRGFPRPKYKTTILAELFSTNVPDFLHGGDGDVPFLVSSKALRVLRKYAMTGLRFSRVEIAKIAMRPRKATPDRGEPEDQILKRKGVANSPDFRLHAVRVTGRVEILPMYPSGRCPVTEFVTPFDLPKTRQIPDLWRPTINGRTFAAWSYCSQRFRDIVTKQCLSNVSFQRFEDHMTDFKRALKLERAETRRK